MPLIVVNAKCNVTLFTLSLVMHRPNMTVEVMFVAKDFCALVTRMFSPKKGVIVQPPLGCEYFVAKLTVNCFLFMFSFMSTKSLFSAKI